LFQPHTWTERLRWRGVSETQRFLLLAIFIGIFVGLLIVCFHITMEFVSWSALGLPAGESRLATVLSPMIGGALASALVLLVFKAAQGSGVNHTKSALYVSNGYVPSSTVVGKFLACSISIGSGNSLGPEDPALHMGAGIASLLGRLLHVGRENMRSIAAVGAAAGLAAAFNTPITAVLFVIEEVIGSWNTAVMGSTVLSAVSAVVVTRWFLGNEPLFRVPQFELTHPSELLIYAAIGLVGGVLAAIFVRGIVLLRNWLDHKPRWFRYAAPAIAGLLTGCIGLYYAQVLGAGYGAIDSALHDQFPWQMLIALGLVKILVTWMCFSAGTPGGMFAPTLFSGAMIGGGLGGLAHLYWPLPTSSTNAYVLVGMGTFFAGVFRAPMTSIFMVFEVSASYVIIVPVMIANTIAYLVSRQFQPVSFFSLIARLEGLELPSLEELREQRSLRVEDAMRAHILPHFTERTPASAALAALASNQSAYGLVIRTDGKASLIEEEKLLFATEVGQGSAEIGTGFSLQLMPRIYPDTLLEAALRQFGSQTALAVFNRAKSDEALGTLHLEDVLRVYGIAPGRKVSTAEPEPATVEEKRR
jgi:chloride channel protein, CIC family